MRTIPFFAARGWTRTARVAPPASSLPRRLPAGTLAFTAPLLETYHLQVHLDRLFQILQE
jgi:hypothetical protein